MKLKELIAWSAQNPGSEELELTHQAGGDGGDWANNTRLGPPEIVRPIIKDAFTPFIRLGSDGDLNEEDGEYEDDDWSTADDEEDY